MKLAAIDTSGGYASCAVTCEGKVLSEKTLSSGLVHSRSLLPMLEDCLQAVGMTPEELDAFVCVAGPGSFTGVRIGVCTVKGLAQALGKPCAGVNTLDVLRAGVPYASLVCPILDARRDQVYGAAYENGVCILPPDARPIAELAEAVRGKQALFLGDGTDRYREFLLETLGDGALFAPPDLNFPRAAVAARVAEEKNEWVSAAALDAIYLRRPQAEREYDEKHPTA